MKRNLIVLGVALLVAGLGLGASAENAVSVLDIAPGVGQLGAGGAGIAVVRGAETLYYNPAGLAGLPGISFSSFYASQMGVASYSAFSLALRGFAVAAELYSSGSIDGYDAAGNLIPGELGYSSSAYMFGFGVDPSMFSFLPKLPFSFSVGGVLKVVSTKIADVAGSGFAFDLAFRMDIPPMSLGPLAVTDAAFGVTLANLFGGLSYDATQDSLPMDIGLGLSARLLGVVLIAADVHLAGSLGVGVTYEPVPTLALRLGILSKGETSITAGVGLNVAGFLIDYAFVSHSVGATHRIGLTLDFSALDIGALGGMLRRILP
jgi:hypothetical protein